MLYGIPPIRGRWTLHEDSELASISAAVDAAMGELFRTAALLDGAGPSRWGRS